MKKLFIKWTTLLLSGAMLLNVGCADYDEDIRHIQDQIDQLTSVSIADLESQIENAEKAVGDMAATIAELEAADTANAELIASLRTELEKAIQEGDAANASALEVAIAYLEGLAKENAAAIAGLQASHDKLQTLVGELTAKHDTDLAAVRLSIETLASEMTKALEAYQAAQLLTDQAQNDKIEELKVLIEALNGRVTLAEEKVLVFDEKLQGLTAEATAIKADLISYKEATNAVLEDLKTRLATIENADLIDRMGEVEGILGEGIKDALAAAGFDNLKDMVNDYIKLDEDHAALKEAFENHKAAINERVAALEAQLAKDIQDMQNAMVEGDGAVKEELLAIIRNINEALTTADEELAAMLKSEVEALQTAIADGDQAIKSELEARILKNEEALKLAEETLNTRIDDVVEDINNINAEIEALKSAVSGNYLAFVETVRQISSQIGILVQNGDVQQILIEGLQTDVVNLNTKLAVTEAGIETLNQQVAAIRTDLVEVLEKAVELENRIKNLEDLEGKIDALLARVQSLVSVPEYTDGSYDLNKFVVGQYQIGNYVDLIYLVSPAVPADMFLAAANVCKLSLEVEKAKTRSNAPEGKILWAQSVMGKPGFIKVRASFTNIPETDAMNVALRINIEANVEGSDIVSDYAGINGGADAVNLPIALGVEGIEDVTLPWNTKVDRTERKMYQDATFSIIVSRDNDKDWEGEEREELTFDEFQTIYGIEVPEVYFFVNPVTAVIGDDIFMDDVSEPVADFGKNKRNNKKVFALSNPAKNYVDFEKNKGAYSIKFANDATKDNLGDYVSMTADFRVDFPVVDSYDHAAVNTVVAGTRYTIDYTDGGTFLFGGQSNLMTSTYTMTFDWTYEWMMGAQVDGQPLTVNPAISAPALAGNKLGEWIFTYEKPANPADDFKPVTPDMFENIINAMELTKNKVNGKENPVNIVAKASEGEYIAMVSLAADTYAWGVTYDVEYSYVDNATSTKYTVKGEVVLNELPFKKVTATKEVAMGWNDASVSFATAGLYSAETCEGFKNAQEFADALSHALVQPGASAIAETVRNGYRPVNTANYSDLAANRARNAIVGSIDKEAIAAYGDTFEQTWSFTTWYGQVIELTANYNTSLLPETLGLKWMNFYFKMYGDNLKAFVQGKLVDGYWSVESFDEAVENLFRYDAPAVGGTALYFEKLSDDVSYMDIFYPSVTDLDGGKDDAHIVWPKVEWVFGSTTKTEVEMRAYVVFEGNDNNKKELAVKNDTQNFFVFTNDPIKSFTYDETVLKTGYYENEDDSKTISFNLLKALQIVDDADNKLIDQTTVGVAPAMVTRQYIFSEDTYMEMDVVKETKTGQQLAEMLQNELNLDKPSLDYGRNDAWVEGKWWYATGNAPYGPTTVYEYREKEMVLVTPGDKPILAVFEEGFAAKKLRGYDAYVNGINYRLVAPSANNDNDLVGIEINDAGYLTFVETSGGTLPTRTLKFEVEATIKYWMGERTVTFIVNVEPKPIVPNVQ